MSQKLVLLCAALALLAPSALASSTLPLAPIPTPFIALAPPADPDHFSFVVGGDNRSTGHGYPMPPALAQICREIGLIRPPFVLWTGDVIEGYGDTPAEAGAEYDAFLNAAALTGVPVFNAPGNHEFSLDSRLLPVYQQRMGRLYGSFDYGHSHFIALNTTSVTPDGKIVSGTLDPAQWDWLAADLDANRSAANTFVFLHHFVFGPPDDDPTFDSGWASRADRDRFHALMVQHHVRAVFCGHNHLFWHAVKDGVDYFISGGSGAPLDASPEQGGYLHYLVIGVSGGTFTTQILQPWHLEVNTPGDGRVWVANTNKCPVDAVGITLHVATPRPGEHLTATAAVRYKDKSKPVNVQIVSVTPDAGANTVTVTVRATLPPARTVEISVSPLSSDAAKPARP